MRYSNRCNSFGTGPVANMFSTLSTQELSRIALFDQLATTTMVYVPLYKMSLPVSRYQLSDIPWPITLLASSYNRKHIFFPKTPHQESTIQAALTDFSNRQRWKIALKNQPLPQHRRSKHTVTPPCRRPLPKSLTAWLSHIRLTIEEATTKLRHSTTYRSNISPLTRWALNCLRDSDWRLLPLDKAPGFIIAHSGDLEYLFENTLTSRFYEPVWVDDAVIARITKRTQGLAKHIAELEENKSLVFKIGRPLHSGSFIARLLVTIKSHKPQSQQTTRPIHASAGNALIALSEWVAQQLNPLKDSSYILRCSRQFASSIQAKRCLESSVMAKLDLKDYYLSGNHADVKRYSCLHLTDGTLKSLLYDALDILLEHQFIGSSFTNDTYRACVGSGMGYAHSSAVSNAVLINKVESYMMSPRCLRDCKIRGAWRYEDDVIVHGIDRDLLEHWTTQYCLRGLPIFTVIKEDFVTVNEGKMDYLDMSVLWDTVRGRFLVKPFFKPHTLDLPLSLSSGHHPSIHTSWASNYIRNLRPRSSNVHLFEEAKQHVLRKFIDAGFPEPFLDNLREIEFIAPPSSNSNRRATVDDDGTTVEHLWLPLPYHPCWQGLASDIQRINNDPGLQSLYQSFTERSNKFMLHLCWKKGYRSLQQLLNAALHGRMDGSLEGE